MKYLPCFVLLLSGVAYADGIPVASNPVSFDDPKLPKIEAPAILEPTPVQIVQSLVGTDTIESAINRALIGQHWQMLDRLLQDYSTLSTYDQTLYAYAKGAMRRQQGRYDEAIALYRKIVSDNPSLHYPRFDLGVMLFENKAYQESVYHIKTAYPYLGEGMQALADRYLVQIEDEQAYKPNLVANFEKTDNVNNAARAKTVQFQGAVWQKTEESLPRKATGIRYGVDVSRERNISNNHFVYGELSGGGVYYWDNKDYSEQNIKVVLGYKHHTATQSLFILPYVEKNWLVTKPYNHLYGVNVGLSRELDASTKLTVGGGYAIKRFNDNKTADKYNSTQVSSNAMLVKVVSPTWMVYGGVDGSYEKSDQAENGSKKIGLSLGSINQLGDVGVRTNIRYANRKFNAPSTGLVYNGSIRNDHEYAAQVALWHNQITYQGLTPQFNIRYQKVDSNQPSFYSKDSLSGFISIDRAF